MVINFTVRTHLPDRKFNDTSHVTDAKAGDPIGWDKIFTEFAPKTIQKKAHAFKFE